MPFCQYCEALFHHGPDIARRSSPRPGDDLLNCPLCAHVKSTYRRKGGAYEPGKEILVFSNNPGIQDRIQSLICYAMIPHLPVLQVFICPDVAQHSFSLERAAVQYRAFTDEDDLLASLFPGRVVHRDGSSATVLDGLLRLVKRHIKTQETALLPTRVLDVGGPDFSMRLVTSNGRRDHYVALSHCWDQDASKHFNTTIGNLSSRTASINFEDMPKTFQDATIVTKRLGLRYIWIDSLCIIQGEDGDWTTEAPKMGQYYGDAFMTIAADCSQGDCEGFLQVRHINMANAFEGTTSASHVLLLPSQRRLKPHSDGEPSSSDGGTPTYRSANDTIYADEVDTIEYQNDEGTRRLHLKSVSWDGRSTRMNPIEDEPLQHRAWTLQERYLSRYTLHFGSEQNFLEMHESQKLIYEDGRETFSAYYWTTLHDSNHALPFRGWYRMIEDYTKRNISFRYDTLTALAGVAQKVSRFANAKYCAGLWESDLSRGLLWCVADPGCPVRWREHSATVSTTDYMGPSWSWAYASGGVRFLLNDLSNRVHPESLLLGYSPSDAIDDIDVPFLELVACEITPLDINFPHGPLIEGTTLTLKAPVYPIRQLRWESKGKTRYYERRRNEISETCHITIDVNGTLYETEAMLDTLAKDSKILEETQLHAIFLAYTLTIGDMQSLVDYNEGDLISRYIGDILGLVVAENADTVTRTCRRVGVFRDSFPLQNDSAKTNAVHKEMFLEKRSKVLTIV